MRFGPTRAVQVATTSRVYLISLKSSARRPETQSNIDGVGWMTRSVLVCPRAAGRPAARGGYPNARRVMWRAYSSNDSVGTNAVGNRATAAPEHCRQGCHRWKLAGLSPVSVKSEVGGALESKVTDGAAALSDLPNAR